MDRVLSKFGGCEVRASVVVFETMTTPPGETVFVEFPAAFEGQAVDTGRMRAKDFAGSVFAIAELIEQGAAVSFDEENTVSLEIRADFRRGSFEFGLIAGVLSTMQQSIVPRTASDLLSLLKNLGVVAGVAKNFLAIVKKTGPRPIEVRTEGDNNVTIIYASGDHAQVMTGVNPAVAKLLQSERLRAALPDVVKPLAVDGVDRLRFGPAEDPTFIAERQEREQFEPPVPHEMALTDSAGDTALELLAPSFVEGNSWKVSQGGQVFFVKILDEEFAKAVADGRPFAKGDYLIVELRTRTYATVKGLKVEREVVRVIEHRRRDEQGTLRLL